MYATIHNVLWLNKKIIILAVLALILLVYPLKLAREYAQSQFVFGNEDKTYWYFRLANKRIHDARFFRSIGLGQVAAYQEDLAWDYQRQGCQYLRTLVDKVDINYLKQERDRNDITLPNCP